MDCVPGRSTHHVLFIDSVGFYYGQCAEICGRFGACFSLLLFIASGMMLPWSTTDIF
jgi:hypothetical protein